MKVIHSRITFVNQKQTMISCLFKIQQAAFYKHAIRLKYSLAKSEIAFLISLLAKKFV